MDNSFIEGIKSGGQYANVSGATTDSDPIKFTFNMRNIGEVTSSINFVYYTGSSRDDNAEGIWWSYYNSGGKQIKLGKNNQVPNPTGSLKDLLYAYNNPDNPCFSSATAPSEGSVTYYFNLKSTATNANVGGLSLTFKVVKGDTEASLRAAFNSISGMDINPSGSGGTYTIFMSAVAKAGDIITHTYGMAYENRGNLTIQAGANEGQILSMDYPVMSNEYLGIEDVAVDSEQKAQAAIGVSQEALQKVSRVRSAFGAFQNRLEHTLEYNENASENLQDAESRLRDADLASGMVELSKNNILMEMGQKVLSMSNSEPESVLNLLRF